MDTQIEQLIQAGAYEAALYQLTHRYHVPLVRFCTGFIGHQMEAEEVVQEVFIQAWEGMPRFRGDASVRVWLFGIARRLCSRHTRRTQRRSSLWQRWLNRRSEADVHGHIDGHKAVEGKLEAKEQKALIAQALQRLKPIWREAVLLRYQQDLDNVELAATLGVTSATARKRVSLGLQALRSSLQPLLEEPPKRNGATPPAPPKHRKRHTIQGPYPAELHPGVDEDSWPLEALRRIGR